ncbi:hypothetical protein JOD64_001334 [Micromonospora luteifusca]|uniref:Uncharacterized protein n=1 Tax=Micromonospora luteifusca TaxID=709860 RepID=A0ABS2LPK3_9ACTN|nr:hypothetical protein [Micromonospora luteifusca]
MLPGSHVMRAGVRLQALPAKPTRPANAGGTRYGSDERAPSPAPADASGVAVPQLRGALAV